MRIVFALSFDGAAAAAEAADVLSERGFEVDVGETVRATTDVRDAEELADLRDERGFDVNVGETLTATTDVRDAEELADLRDELRVLAAELGGEFLGNGSFVRL